MRRVLIISLAVILGGCAHTSKRVENGFIDLQYGMTKERMIALMGRPDTIEIYKKSDESRWEVYFYVRKYRASQLKVPVGLINNKVVGWGKTYYEDHVSANDIRIR
jgi:outer membrane protein assembly factor BamE (lipoprotein component of BamABCDE complex)